MNQNKLYSFKLDRISPSSPRRDLEPIAELRALAFQGHNDLILKDSWRMFKVVAVC